MKITEISKKSRILFGVAVVAMLMVTVLALCLSGCSSQNRVIKGITGVTSVSIDAKESKIEVHAEATASYISSNPKAKLFLVEVDASSNLLDLDQGSIIDSKKASEIFEFKFDMYNGTKSRLYSGFVLAEYDEVNECYKALGSPVYVSDASALADSYASFPVRSSIKGLNFTMQGTAEKLNVRHTVVTVAIEDYIMVSGGKDAIPYEFDGLTYYMSRAAVESLDAKIKACTRSDMTVYLEFVINDPSRLLGILVNDPNSAVNTLHYSIDMALPSTARHMAGFFEFFAKRYTRADGEYGFAGAYIIGDQVNRAENYNYSIYSDPDKYVENYESLLRTAHTALTSVCADGRVFASIGNNWTVSAGSSLIDMPAKDLLNKLQTVSENRGSFDWGISISANYETYGVYSPWDQIGSDMSATHISPNNISELTDLMGTKYLCGGERRELIVNGFSIACPSVDEESLKLQAAMYAYAYYKIIENGYASAFIWDVQLDNASAGNADYTGEGLVAVSGDGVPNILSEKPIYKVFEYIDTDVLSAYDYIGAVIGEKWERLYEDYSARVITRSVSVHDGSVSYELVDDSKSAPVFDFSSSGGLGFVSVTPDDYVELSRAEQFGTPALHAIFKENINDIMGISKADIDPEIFKDSDRVTVRLMCEAPTNTAEGTTVKITLCISGTLEKSDTGRDEEFTFESSVDVDTAQWTDATFDISGFDFKNVKDVDFTLLVTPKNKTSASEGASYDLWVKTVTAGNSNDGNIFTIVILIVILVALAAGVTVCAIWFFNNYSIKRG